MFLEAADAGPGLVIARSALAQPVRSGLSTGCVTGFAGCAESVGSRRRLGRGRGASEWDGDQAREAKPSNPRTRCDEERNETAIGAPSAQVRSARRMIPSAVKPP